MVPKTNHMEVKRVTTKVEMSGRYFHFVHKAVVYHVKREGDTTTIFIDGPNRWRPHFLFIRVSPKGDLTEKEAAQLVDSFVNRYLWCFTCHRELSFTEPFRVDIKGGQFVNVSCAYCDPTVKEVVDYFESLESQNGGKP